MSAPVVTRFAPSPTGLLHLGHAYSALFAAEAGDRLILRIEDIDQGRCRAEFEHAIFEDLAWLGLSWEEPVRRQSDHMDDYRKALDHLAEQGVIYPCFCTRAEIRAEIEQSPAAPHGPDGALYPGTCGVITQKDRELRMASGSAYALRLDINKAIAITGALDWDARKQGSISAQPERHGDVVLARKDTPTSYHLAVTVDDALQGITLVTRGEDLLAATDIHCLLQALLELPSPEYLHHALLTDKSGKRLAKRDHAATIRSLREAGHSPSAVIAMIKEQKPQER
jgi:glutamyl-Q tRNA(Asp) synthetase